MINTINIKQQQLNNGFFTVGSGKEVVLIMGSCRVLNFVNYLNEWNEANGNPYTIHSIDPFNFNWNIHEERVDYEKELIKWEQDKRMLDMIASVDIFIHEFYANAGMFNVFRDSNKTIYDFGMKTKMDICIPNWNDYFVLAGDIVSFDLVIRKKAIQDYNVLGKLSDQTKKEILILSLKNYNKFYDVCDKSNFPEMIGYFKENYLAKRLFWSYNHTSKVFTLALWKYMNDKCLHLDLSKGFNPDHEDVFANNYTKLTELDIELYGYEWGEEIIQLKDKLF